MQAVLYITVLPFKTEPLNKKQYSFSKRLSTPLQGMGVKNSGNFKCIIGVNKIKFRTNFVVFMLFFGAATETI